MYVMEIQFDYIRKTNIRNWKVETKLDKFSIVMEMRLDYGKMIKDR